jgi:hypothetical protein
MKVASQLCFDLTIGEEGVTATGAPSVYTNKGYSNPITDLDRPLEFQEVEATRFLDNRHMKVVRLSAIRTGRLYPTGNTPGTHFCYRLSRPQGHSATERIMSMKIPITPSGIEPLTFRLVARCLNQLCQLVPPMYTNI